MRKNILHILYLSVMLIFVSCEEQLDEVPKDFLAPNNFFNTEEECIQAVNGVYRQLPSLYASSGFWAVTEAGCDDIMVKFTGNVSETYQYDAANTGGASSIWNYAYAIIMNANMVINRLEDAPIKDNVKARLTGEAQFIRAFMYYMLSNTFGDVPLWTEELDIAQVSNLERTDIEAVKEQIRLDLTEAAEGLPNRFSGQDVGRVNKAAALLLLAKQHLIDKNWQAAKSAATTVSQMTEFELLDNYGDNFDIYKRNAKESVFEVQYYRTSTTNYVTNSRYVYFMPPKDGPGVFAGVDFGSSKLNSYEVFYPSVKLVNQFEEGDLRKDVILAYGFEGTPFNRMNEHNGMPFFGPKFWDLDGNDYFSGKNLTVLRFVEAYLILAEAENELGNSGPAHTWINKVRERAGLDNLEGLSQTQMRDAIMKERGIEFCGEFQRKWDLLRWGKLIETVKSVAADNPEGAANIQSYHLLYPIDEDELTKNTSLVQNPGY